MKDRENLDLTRACGVLVGRGLRSTGYLLMGLLCLLIFTSPLTAGNPKTVHSFAQIGDGGGFRTVFLIKNSNQEEASIVLELFADDGSPLELQIGATTASMFELTVAAGETLRLETSNSGPTPVAGWARLVATRPVGAQALFEIFSSGSLVTQAAVESSLPLTEAEGFLRIESGSQTAVAIANLAPRNSIRVRITIRDAAGNDLATQDIILEARAHTAQFFPQIFAGTDDLPVGSFIIRLSGPAAITVLQQTGLVIGSLPLIVDLF